MSTPYIGITDFTQFHQVEEMLRVFQMFRRLKLPTSPRQLHVGVMMSRKTLLGLPTKWVKAFPPNDEVARIFGSDETFNCLHYADYDEDPSLWGNLTRAIRYGGVGIHALQLDMVWPAPSEVGHAVHSSRKQLEVILQVNSQALDQVSNDPKVLVRRLENYQGVIHRVLLDKSMGRGLGMDAEVLLPFARAIRARFPELGITVAGGLGPETLHLVVPIIREFPDVSIDAQGRLRSSGNAIDPIHWGMAANYLERTTALFD